MAELPLPPHFDPSRVGEVSRVPYEDRAREAVVWADEHGVGPAAEDVFRLCLLAVDVQNTFCVPDFYRNLGEITQVLPSLDTHHAMQVFHAIWLVDEDGEHPAAYTLVSADDIAAGRWRVNSAVAEALGIDPDYANRHLAHYTQRLAEGGKYDLTVWPYHAMLGGIGHALVSGAKDVRARRFLQPLTNRGPAPITRWGCTG
ncbi:MAG: hypothetical protein E6G21_09780 [Actinobacteria bacterium]|nr:MAG: hypothetical protein E6G21_09780 [Actinomycetota bacterium]